MVGKSITSALTTKPKKWIEEWRENTDDDEDDDDDTSTHGEDMSVCLQNISYSSHIKLSGESKKIDGWKTISTMD